DQNGEDESWAAPHALTVDDGKDRGDDPSALSPRRWNTSVHGIPNTRNPSAALAGSARFGSRCPVRLTLPGSARAARFGSRCANIRRASREQQRARDDCGAAARADAERRDARAAAERRGEWGVR